ncbi:MAG: hypothetical protein AB2A00_36050 [Myxococcota bacterium]
MQRCDTCRSHPEPYDSVTVVGQGHYCGVCYSRQLARDLGLPFSGVDPEPLVFRDSAGKTRTFHLRSRLYEGGQTLDAFEQADRERGLHFRVLGDHTQSVMELVALLYPRIEQQLAQPAVTRNRDGLSINDSKPIRARIQWDDDEDGNVPRLIIDGHPVTWEELGQLLMRYEGFDLDLRIRDAVLDARTHRGHAPELAEPDPV